MPRALHTSFAAAFVALAMGCDAKTPKKTEPVKQGSTLAQTTDRPMLLVFSRDYCTPCQVMKPWIAELAEEVDTIDVVTLNVDRKKYEHLGGFFKISAVPTLLYLEADGHIARRTNGLAKKSQMRSVLQELRWAR